jgi:hypothetical protein
MFFMDYTDYISLKFFSLYFKTIAPFIVISICAFIVAVWEYHDYGITPFYKLKRRWLQADLFEHIYYVFYILITLPGFLLSQLIISIHLLWKKVFK